MYDLELATIRELVDELKRRFPAGLLVAGVRETPGDDTADDFSYFQVAPATMAVGMCRRLSQIINRNVKAETAETDFDDEAKP